MEEVIINQKSRFNPNMIDNYNTNGLRSSLISSSLSQTRSKASKGMSICRKSAN